MISLKVNGKDYRVDAPPDVSLLWVLRDYLGLTGTKYGCGVAECGSCTVIINGKAERSCQISAGNVQGANIVTIEGLAENHPVKRAWIDEQVVQCGYCQPGMIMQVAALLGEQKNPKEEDIFQSMDDMICRCGTYAGIKRGIRKAIAIMKEEA